MKKLICSSILQKYAYVITLSEEMIHNLELGLKKSKELSECNFKQGAILKIPFEGNEISLYDFGTIYKIRLEKGTKDITPDGIEYMILDEHDRYAFAKQYNLPYNYKLVDDDSLKNLKNIAVHGAIYIENGMVNFSIEFFDISTMSETIPYEFWKNIINI